MPDMITRCPKCATAFRISDTLLKSAKGMVRCGSCLNVFNASEHLENKPAPVAPKKASPSIPQRQSKPLFDGSEEDATESNTGNKRTLSGATLFDDANKRQAQLHTTHDQAKPLATPISITGFLKHQDGIDDTRVEDYVYSQPNRGDEPENKGLFERSTTAQERSALEDELDPDEDESWALDLLKDDDDPELNVQFKKITEKPKPVIQEPTQEKPLPEVPAESAFIDKPDTFREAVTPPSGAPTSSPEESLRAGNSDDDDSIQSSENTSPPAPLSTAPPVFVAPPAESSEAYTPKVEEIRAPKTEVKSAANKPQISAPAKVGHNEPAKRARAAQNPLSGGPQNSSGSLHDVIAAIEPEPLDVDWEPSPNWKKRLLWPALALVALMLLLGQVAWLEFHRLSRVEPYRSMYAVACQYLNCTLPDLIDRTKIKTSNLVVRSHPEVENALMVDVILQNNAEFEQTFPSLLLTFADLRNETVASRLLTPDEYLGGELAGRDTMPVKQPIHIGLEIVDPGEEAVSYSIAIVD